MKRYIYFGLALMMASPVYVSAQNDDVEEVATKMVAARKAVKRYETRTVKGRVIDAATGKPVSGAIVLATGTNGYSALTDDNGNYSAKVPLFTSNVTITSPGYSKATLGLQKGENQKTVKLLSDKFKATYKADDNVLATKSEDKFNFNNSINVKDEIQKELGAYAYTTQRSGTPGIGSTMFVQGLNSLNANAQPLVVVDGVIVDQEYNRHVLHSGFVNDILSNINPDEIADVQILRNGTALYGARGANGVIIINTKRSSSMATRITANASAAVNFEPKYYDMMDASGYRNYSSELLKGVNTKRTIFPFLNEDPNYPLYYKYHNNTDWKEDIYRTSITQKYGVSVEGGDDIAQYNLSVGYLLANSNLEYNDMDRLNIRFNTDIVLSNKIDVRFDASFSNTTRDIRDDGAPSQYNEGTPTSPSFLAYVKSPFLHPYAYANGAMKPGKALDTVDEDYLNQAMAYYSDYNYQLGNPIAFNEYAEAENKNRFETSILNLAVTPKYRILPNLVLSEHFSYTLVNNSNKYYVPVNGVPTYYVSSVYANRENQVSSQASKQNSIQSDTRLAWNKRYNAHNVSAFGGARINIENFTTSSQLGYNTNSDKTPFMSSGLLNSQTSGVDQSWNNMDIYLQANYDYLGRYFLQANLTASGSSRFGTDADGLSLLGTKWGIFPGIQAGWVVSNEPWFANVQGIDYLKVSAGYDVSGNDDIDPFASKSYFGASLYLHAISGLTLEGIGNKEIKWETTRRFNAGVEANFINNRLSVGFNFFHSKTTDLLSLQTLGFLSGIKQNWANNGELSNTGFDMNVRGKLVASKNWTWELGASMGHYENRITNLGLGEGKTSYVTEAYNANILTKEGSAANLFYGYMTNGVYATAKEAKDAGLYIRQENGDRKYFEAGDVIFMDMNGDKEINEKDMVVIGNPNPDIYGNIFSTLTYKRLKLDVNFKYSLGNDVYNYMRSQLEGGNRFMNQTTAVTRRWQTEGQITDIPRITFQDPMGNSRFSDRWIEDGSYLKLKAVTLSYDMPINSSFIQGFQIWVQGNNLFTLTKYLGTDPEFSVTNSVIGQGIDYGCIAQSRSVVAGIKVNF